MNNINSLIESREIQYETLDMEVFERPPALSHLGFAKPK